jgi:hypothetical protein
VCPAFSFDHKLDGRLAHAIGVREFSMRDAACGIERPDGSNVIGCQNRTAAPFASRHRVWIDPCVMAIASRQSALALGVLLILAVGASEQMRRIDAPRVVARVAHIEAVGDGSVGEFVRDAMRVDHARPWTNRVIRELPVAIQSQAAGPQPAIGSFLNTRPEPCGVILSQHNVIIQNTVWL